VWMDKTCLQHGRFSALLAADSRHYFKPGSRSAKQSCCGSSCAIPAMGPDLNAGQGAWTNHSCTILIEITERCNLSCPTCFAGSSPGLHQFQWHQVGAQSFRIPISRLHGPSPGCATVCLSSVRRV
jgi:uncharacterized radical SAM superfamily Fe-S cluster-containing enzyme